MARLTVNFSNKYNDVYKKVMSEDNSSSVICQALDEYYKTHENDEGMLEDIASKLDLILYKLDDIKRDGN